MLPVPCRAIRRSRNLLRVPLIVALAWGALCGLVVPSGAALGKWSPPNLINSPPGCVPPNCLAFQEIHMALLPGDGSPYHSRILTWQASDSSEGAELGWSEGTVGCVNPPYTLNVLGTWDPQANIFCGSHTQLANGELLSAGGHEFNLGIGNTDSRTFAPGTSTTPGIWTGRPVMKQARFYPTMTTMADGRAVVTGGNRHTQAWFLGGRVNGNPPATGTGDLLHRYGRGTGASWDPPVTPLEKVLGQH